MIPAKMKIIVKDLYAGVEGVFEPGERDVPTELALALCRNNHADPVDVELYARLAIPPAPPAPVTPPVTRDEQTPPESASIAPAMETASRPNAAARKPGK